MFDKNIGRLLYCKDGGKYRYFKVLDENVRTLIVLELEEVRDHEYSMPGTRFLDKDPHKLVEKRNGQNIYYRSSLGEDDIKSFYFYEGTPFYIKP